MRWSPMNDRLYMFWNNDKALTVSKGQAGLLNSGLISYLAKVSAKRPFRMLNNPYILKLGWLPLQSGLAGALTGLQKFYVQTFFLQTTEEYVRSLSHRLQTLGTFPFPPWKQRGSRQQGLRRLSAWFSFLWLVRPRINDLQL